MVSSDAWWLVASQAFRERLPAVDRRGVRPSSAGRGNRGDYPLLPGDVCTLLACDFDKGTWLLDALAYLDACHANEVPAVLERSRSGNDAHVWVFFTEPVSAIVVRCSMVLLLGCVRPVRQARRDARVEGVIGDGVLVDVHELERTAHRSRRPRWLHHCVHRLGRCVSAGGAEFSGTNP
jgi:hypothetical protein